MFEMHCPVEQSHRMVQYLHLELSYPYVGIEVVRRPSVRDGEKEPLGYEP